MKKIFIGIITYAFLYSLPATTVFNVEGMSCPSGCTPKVSKAALEISGVESCDVSFDESKATVVYDNEKVTETEILSSLQLNTSFKYALDKMNKESTGAACSKSCCSKTKQTKKKSFFQRLFGM